MPGWYPPHFRLIFVYARAHLHVHTDVRLHACLPIGVPDCLIDQGGRVIEVDVPENATIRIVKKAIEDKEGIPVQGMSIRTTSDKV